jgi:ubiquinol-cytochrome c reductase iron-sulfur subunit
VSRGRRVAPWLLLSIASSVSLVVVYARGGQPQLEGILLSSALIGLGAGLAAWARRVLPSVIASEPRHRLASTPEEREAVEHAVDRAELARRPFLKRLFGVAVAGLGAAAVVPVASLGPRPKGRVFRTAWRDGVRLVTEQGEPLRASEVPDASALVVFPEGHPESVDSQAVLLRLPPSELRVAHANGLVAYSRLCTHAGCPVGLYQTASRELLCPCHQSVFDVRDGARPTAGPAARALPQLPLRVDAEGYLRAAGDFTEEPGPSYWSRA